MKGKPGSGKSVLMKQTFLWTQANQTSLLVVSFFFNARGGPLEKAPKGLFRSLIHQLVRQRRHLLATFLPKFRTKRETLKPRRELQEGELGEYFANVVASGQISSMIVFIDALDECGKSQKSVRSSHSLQTSLRQRSHQNASSKFACPVVIIHTSAFLVVVRSF